MMRQNRNLTRALTLALAAAALAGCGTKPTGALVTSAALKTKASSKAASSSKLSDLPTPAKPSVTVSKGVEAAVMAEAAAPIPVPDEVIVRFKQEPRDLPGATRLDSPDALRNTAVYKLDKDSFSGYSLQQVAEDWEDAGDIDYIEPNYVYKALTNDPNSSQSWGVDYISAPRIWTFTQGAGIKVAVVDTGVDASHPDLAGRILGGADLVNKDNDATDDHGHGTHVAGTIAAIANNGIAVAGVAPGASVVPVKVLDSKGQGYNATIAAGIIKAADLGARVINMSLGGTDNSETIRRAVQDVQARGVIVVAAAGNDGVSTPFYPAANDGVIAVGAVDSSNRKASFSNDGRYIDVAAPGVAIGSTARGGGISTMNGTSMAAPHVSGAIALLLGKYPTLKSGHMNRLMTTTGSATTGFRGGSPRCLNVEDAFVNVANLDMTPPTSASNLTAVAGAPGEVNLAWSAATDNRSGVQYRVVQDGQEIGTTSSTTFTARSVSGNASFYVVAFDTDGNEAARSSTVSASGGAASTKITDLVVSSRSSSSLTLTWKTTEPMRCYVQWGADESLANGTGWDTAPSTTHTYTLSNLKRFTNYHYRVIAATNSSQLHYTETRKQRTKLWWLFQVQ